MVIFIDAEKALYNKIQHLHMGRALKKLLRREVICHDHNNIIFQKITYLAM